MREKINFHKSLIDKIQTITIKYNFYHSDLLMRIMALFFMRVGFKVSFTCHQTDCKYSPAKTTHSSWARQKQIVCHTGHMS